MNPKEPEVVAVTVTYGDRFGLLERVAKCLLASPQLVRWVIVTNGVGPEAEQRIAALDERVILRSFAVNAGSAPAYADGIATALAGDPNADFVWLLDDDNLPEPDALVRLLDAHAELTRDGQEACHIAVCALRLEVQAQFAGGFARRRPSSFLGFHWRESLRNLGRHLWWPAPAPATGSVALATAPYGGLLLPVRLLRAVGLPDPRFVLYADDTEFTDRIIRNGGQLLLITSARITDLCASWQRQGRLLHAWLDAPDAARVFYGARNEAWFDAHRLAAQRWLYRIHRGIYLTGLWCASRRAPRRDRFALLLEAIRAGEAGRLGVDARFPLHAHREDA